MLGLLNQLGASLAVDGIFSAKTEATVKAFQKKAGIKHGDQSHAALMAAVAEDDAGKQAMTETKPDSDQAKNPGADKKVIIVSDGGNVNIRVGTKFKCITTIAPGMRLPYIASTVNGRHAVLVDSQIGWINGEYSR